MNERRRQGTGEFPMHPIEDDIRDQKQADAQALWAYRVIERATLIAVAKDPKLGDGL